jgi:dipeptidase E
MEPGNPLLDEYVLSLSRRKKPRVCFFPSASGDADHYVVRFYRHFSSSVCEPSHVSLFRRDSGPGNLRDHLLAQDVIYVGGGSILSLLGVWRAHGIDEDLRAAWRAGVILCGVSAGSLCWFASGLTAYHHDARPYEGLGFLPHSNAVHYEEESHRRPAYHQALLAGMPGGYAASDGAALHFVGESLQRVVLSRREARAYRVEAAGDDVVELPLEATYLGERPKIALAAA